MDIGFEGGFSVLRKSINRRVHPNWDIPEGKSKWVILPETRFTTVFANDIRRDAMSAWCNYFNKKSIPSSVYHLGSIVDLVKEYEEGKHDIFPNRIDVVTGGFPCQDFSIAGKRLGFNSNKNHDGALRTPDEPSTESRGQLYIWMHKVVSIVQPKVFIAENVKGLVDLENVKQVIENDFSRIADGGYLVFPARVLHAVEYGVPQGRERVIFIGFKKSALTKHALEALTQDPISDEYNPYPLATHYPPSNVRHSEKLEKFVTVQDALEDLPEPCDAKEKEQQKFSKAKYMGKHCQGQTEVNLNGIGPTIRSEHHGNIEFRRLSLEHGGKYVKELLNGAIERRLTIRECARIQTFPDNYKFIISKKRGLAGGQNVSASDAYKLIGNAVPPLLAFHIAMNLQEKWGFYFGKENFK